MEHAALKGLSYFIDCSNKPANFNTTLLEFLKSKANVRKMDPKVRYQVYDLLRKLVNEKSKTGTSMHGEIIYSIVAIIDGENNPENLLLCFNMISAVLKNFDNLEPYVEDIFEWLGSYYPLDYSPADDGSQDAITKIQRSDLVDALYDCFYANQLNADYLFEILLEKLDSNVMSTKLESLNCLIRCYHEFPLESVKKYNSTVWTAIRASCLRKIETLDQRFFELSLTALGSLAQKLSEDKELHFVFLSDMYEELSIAFRKPEMELFEPAARLMTHAILPTIMGFDYVLDKILPVSLNALEAQELRPLPGLTYLIQKLSIQYPDARLKPESLSKLQKLVVILAKFTEKDQWALKLLDAIVSYSIDLSDQDVDEITKVLDENYRRSKSAQLERCLALFCLRYKRLQSVGIETQGYELKNLLSVFPGQVQTSEHSLRIFLRVIITLLHSLSEADLSSLNVDDLASFLTRLRNHAQPGEVVQMIAQIHAIILNKFNNEETTKIAMTMFSSDCCQRLIPASDDGREKSHQVYLPIIAWSFKALVIRNHQLSTPLVNLVLNYVTSDRTETDAAIDGARMFRFILSETEDAPLEALWSPDRSYRKFALYKQKFYVQTSKEIKLRYQKESSDSQKRQTLLCCVAIQLPNLPLSVFKKDLEWLIRELILVMSTMTDANQDNYLDILYHCLTSLMKRDIGDQFGSFISSIIDLNLKNASPSRTLRVRKASLDCLASIAGSVKHSDLLMYRSDTVERLQPCLSDKKRIVREAAAKARLKWVLIGQPIG